MKTINLKQYSTAEGELPRDRQVTFWWHPKTLDWRLGTFYAQYGGYAPGFFAGEGAWYVCEGHTWWMPEPRPPG